MFGAVDEVAKRFPVGRRCDFVVILLGDGDGHAAVSIDGCRGREAVAEGEGVVMVGVVALADEFGQVGKADGLAAVGVAGGLDLPVVGELHPIDALVGLVGRQRRGVGAERLSPHVFGAPALQHPGHVATCKLLGGRRRALHVGKGVHVVAVVERGLWREGVAALGVVRAGVEAVVEGAGGVVSLSRYEAAHVLLAVVYGAVDVAGHDAIVKGDFAFRVCREHHSCGAVGVVLVAVSDFHIADAARESGVATRLESKYAQRLAVGRHLPRYAQVLDGGVCYKGEQREVITAVTVPIDRDGVSLSVEGAAIVSALAAYFLDVRAEVEVGGELGVEVSLPGSYEVAELLPVFFRGDFAHVVYDDIYCHGAVGINGIFGIETIGEDELVGVGGVVCHAQDFLRGG